VTVLEVPYQAASREKTAHKESPAAERKDFYLYLSYPLARNLEAESALALSKLKLADLEGHRC
jgi:hypothetical protein